MGVAATLGLAALLALTACTPLGFAQRSWENRIDKAAGVEDASWSYYNGWPSSGSKYNAEIAVSPDLTEEQALEIARLSCKGEPRLDEVIVRTGRYDSPTKATMYGLASSCFNPDELAGYARVLAAIKAMGPSFVGEVIVHAYDPADDYSNEGDTGALTLNAEATSSATLFTLLDEIRSRNEDAPLDFRGWVGDDGSTITNFGLPIDVRIPAGYDLGAALPLLERAYDLAHVGIVLTSEGITVSPGAVSTISSPETLELQAEAQQVGIPFEVLPPQGRGLSEQEQAPYGELVLSLAALPGVYAVDLPGQDGDPATAVRAADPQAIAAALDLIAVADPLRAEFYIESPSDNMFARVLASKVRNPGMTGAFAKMVEARQAIPFAESSSLVVGSDNTRMSISLSDGITRAQFQQARRTLLPMLASPSPIDEINLDAPESFPSEVLSSKTAG